MIISEQAVVMVTINRCAGILTDWYDNHPIKAVSIDALRISKKTAHWYSLTDDAVTINKHDPGTLLAKNNIKHAFNLCPFH